MRCKHVCVLSCIILVFASGIALSQLHKISNPVASSNIPQITESIFPTSRDPLLWGSSFDSPWNIPLSMAAELHPVGTKVGGVLPTPTCIYVDRANISISDTYPVKTLRWAGGSTEVYCNPSLSADGTWNNCGAFLKSDGISVIEGQTTCVTPGDNPSFSGTSSVAYPSYNLKTSQGIVGSHGGSYLSCLGGTLRKGELTGPAEIFHSLGGGLDAMRCYSQETGHVWPAANEDNYYKGNNRYAYGGSDSYIAPGSLLVLKEDFDEMTLCKTFEGQKIARAMKRYGFYCKDDTYAVGYHQINIDTQDEEAISAINTRSFQKDWKVIFSHCYVVINNSKNTPGGGIIGSPRRMPYAPPFIDGSGAPPMGLLVEYIH